MTEFAGSHLTCLRGERLVFVGLSFRVAAGEALVLTGPNASGKSSLLRLMALLPQPWRGGLSWDGASVTDDPDSHRARLRYVGHPDAIKPALTAEENLGFWAVLDGNAEPGRRTRQALEGFGLGPVAAVPARYFSAGQKRRLTLARLLLTPVPLWLLDEPTVGLDQGAIARLGEALAGHRAAGGLVVAATHTDLPLPGAGHLRLDAFAPTAPQVSDHEGASP
jgi:heme exporter protein A